MSAPHKDPCWDNEFKCEFLEGPWRHIFIDTSDLIVSKSSLSKKPPNECLPFTIYCDKCNERVQLVRDALQAEYCCVCDRYICDKCQKVIYNDVNLKWYLSEEVPDDESVS